MKEKEKKAEILLTECPIVTLVSIGADGYPRPVPMMHLKSNGVHKIWFGTGASTEKVANFRRDPHAAIAFHNDNGSALLRGKVHVSHDEELRSELWQDMFLKYFPQGKNDPEFMIIEFVAEKVDYWDNTDTRKLNHH